MVLLSSPFWVAWLAVILNQQGGLSGAEGSAEGEVCVCLFEALSFFVHICLVVLRIHIKDIVLYFALYFHFSKCFFLLLVVSPLCFVFHLIRRRAGVVVVVYLRHFFVFRILPLYEEGRSMFDFTYVFLYHLGMRRGGLCFIYVFFFIFYVTLV